METNQQTGNYLIILIVLLVISLLIVFSFTFINKFSSPLEVSLNGYRVTDPSPFEGDLKDFLILAKHFAENHEYDRENYNCVNYSQDLKDISDQLGFDVEVVKGCDYECKYNDNCSCHQWLRVKVDLEPQDGIFRDYSKDYPIQEVVN